MLLSNYDRVWKEDSFKKIEVIIILNLPRPNKYALVIRQIKFTILRSYFKIKTAILFIILFVLKYSVRYLFFIYHNTSRY